MHRVHAGDDVDADALDQVEAQDGAVATKSVQPLVAAGSSWQKRKCVAIGWLGTFWVTPLCSSAARRDGCGRTTIWSLTVWRKLVTRIEPL